MTICIKRAIISTGVFMTESKALPPWAGEMPEGSFISYNPTYKVGEYFNLYKSGTAGKMKYYFFDPTEHGYAKGKSYPLLVFLHGRSNALEGDICINYTGAEFYATEKYQEAIGGAYVLVPLANEIREADGQVTNTWSEDYTKPLFELINSFIKKIAEPNGGAGKKFLFGNSAGATMVFIMAAAYPAFFNALIPIGSSSIPEDSVLDELSRNNVHLFLAIGKRDEFNSYKDEILPRLPALRKMKDCYIFTPDWVYNGDKGIASINFGIEMGQHCLVNPMHCNLMFDDGTPMYAELPDGVLGWIKTVL